MPLLSRMAVNLSLVTCRDLINPGTGEAAIPLGRSAVANENKESRARKERKTRVIVRSVIEQRT